jgi:uncharacterized protein with GYD domain
MLLSELEVIPQIKSVLRVIGPYDIVAKIQIDDEEEYRGLSEIARRIRKMNNIRSTMTLLTKNIENTIVN